MAVGLRGGLRAGLAVVYKCLALKSALYSMQRVTLNPIRN